MISREKTALKVEKTAFFAYFAIHFMWLKLILFIFFSLQDESTHIEFWWKCILNFRILPLTPKTTPGIRYMTSNAIFLV